MIEYRVSIPDPRTHLLHVELTASGLPSGPAVFWMPAWTPGSYLIREFARHVQSVSAEADGRPAPVTRIEKDAWRVSRGGGPLTLRYDVYGFDLSVRAAHVDETHAFWNGAAVYLTADPLLPEPARLVVSAPAGWKMASPLAADGDGFAAPDYDALCDGPVHLSPDDRTVEFTAAGVPHALTVWGHGNEELPGLAADLGRIVEQASVLFGGLPYRRYLFLTLLADHGRGGLEHENGCTLLYPRTGFRPDRARQDFLVLAAHELFHAWNVKRLRPAALIPYRFRTENLTRLLWFFEGVTSYYELLLPVRAGVITPARFLELWGERMTQLARTPGRKLLSAEEASLLAWVKHYRPDENTPNSTVSYYLKGSLLALDLDLTLRRRGTSLDDLMRLLWEKYGAAGRGVPEGAVREEAEALARGPLPLFELAVAGSGDPTYADLSAVGLVARSRPRESVSDRGGGKMRDRGEGASWLGVVGKPERTTLAHVLSGGPAEAAGLCPDDELIAADGLRLSGEGWLSRLEGQPAGTRVELTYLRRDELRRTHVVMGERPIDTFWIERSEAAGEPERRALQAWLGHPLDGRGGGS